MGWTTPRTWVDGEFETAPLFNVYLRDNLNALPEYVLARKTADQSVTSSTTLQNDTHLVFALGTNQVWLLKLVLWITDASGAAHFKSDCTMPASGVSTLSTAEFNASASLTVSSFTQAASNTVFVTPSAGAVVEWTGFATTGGTSGNWQLRWAQNTSNGTAVTVKKGSFLSGYQIA